MEEASERPHTPANGRNHAVLVGRAVAFGRPGVRSGIAKQPVAGPVMAGELGLTGDEQGDLRVHGGPDKAVHCYAWQHYARWRQALAASDAALALLQAPGAFGENLSVEGLDEHGVCIGDRWQIGHSVMEVSQGRQPCWKLNQRFGVPDMARRVQDSLMAGWYMRVLAPGDVQAGDTWALLERLHPDWSIARLLGLIRDRDTDASTLAAVLRLPLPPSWQRLFSRRLESGTVEDWASRMVGRQP
ncbi:MOSC domain-containing protein [Uliginosibacterium sp. H1]|uniref:MOSC domain-containing protein n=1 Tax=Uliginosibacterium sp. H1 TaxID=3114757 RepID=UPI002E18A154|nr:MOSC domain-containing protein [Uliginosibacterium sp. H1]